MEKASKLNIFHHFDRSNCIRNSYEMQNNYEIVNHACKNYKSIVISKPCPGTGKFKYVCQYIPFNSMDKMRKLGYRDARSESRRNVTKCYEILTKYLRNNYDIPAKCYEILTKYLRNTYEILTKYEIITTYLRNVTKYLRNTYEIVTKYLRNTYEILTK